MPSTKRNPAPALSPLETDVMQIVWDRGEVTASEVRQALIPLHSLAHTTVITILDRLLKKRAVQENQGDGWSRRFAARIPREQVADQVLGSIRRKFFRGSAASLVAHLIRDPAVGDDEMKEIRRLLQAKPGGRPEGPRSG